MRTLHHRRLVVTGGLFLAILWATLCLGAAGLALISTEAYSPNRKVLLY